MNGKPTNRAGKRPTRKQAAEAAAMGLMFLGVAMVCQPFVHALFRWGFLVTLAGIVAFTVASHLRERDG